MSSSLAIVVCAAPLARLAPEVASAAQDAGWDVHLIATPEACSWIDVDRLRAITGAAPTVDYREPGQAKRGRPAAALVCPMTYNTGNKLAGGIADNYAMAVLAEIVGAGRTLVAVPMINGNLWGNPAWRRSLDLLTPHVTWVSLHDGTIGQPRHIESGSGPEILERFDPAWAVRPLGHPGHP